MIENVEAIKSVFSKITLELFQYLISSQMI